MKKNSLLLIGSGILLFVLFLQFCSPAKTNSQKETEMSIDPTASKPIDTPKSIDQLKFIDTTISIDEHKSIDQPKSIDKPKTIDSAKPINKPKPIKSPKTIDSPKSINPPDTIDSQKSIDKPKIINPQKTIDPPMPIDEPASLISSGFTLKLLKATIKGTSTLHEWESHVTEIEGKGSFQIKDKLLSTIQDVEIKIAVMGIKSEEGKKMDDKTYEAFKSDENPFITYSFSNAVVKISTSQIVAIEVSGNLSMAGTSKLVSLSANGKELANGDLQLTVSKKIKMTDYNMEPPVMFLGTIKVGDEITVSFDFELTKLQKANNSN